MKTKTKQDFKTHKGDHRKLVFKVEDTPEGGLDTFDIQWVITEVDDLEDVLVEKKTPEDITINGDSFELDLNEEDYEDLNKQHYHHEARVIDGYNNISTTHSGIIEIIPSTKIILE